MPDMPVERSEPHGERVSAPGGGNPTDGILGRCQRRGCFLSVDRPGQRYCFVHFAESRDRADEPKCVTCGWPTRRNELALGECRVCSQDPFSDPDRAWKERA